MVQLYEDMKSGFDQMEALANSFEKELRTLPQGHLSVRSQGHQTYYYHNLWQNNRRKKTFLSLKSGENRELIHQLQRRRFIEKSLSFLHCDLMVLKQAIQKFIPYDPAEIQRQLSPAYAGTSKDPFLWLPCEPDLQQWARAEYDRYMGYPEGLIHETSFGLKVRSKSEAMIAETLNLYGIPFHYEETLDLASRTYAPDFTIMHPFTYGLFYWEHLGKMDDPEYVLSNAQKLTDYQSAGIQTGSNLILTLENQSCPLTLQDIRTVIEKRLFR